MTIGSGAWADRLDALLRDRRELFEAQAEENILTVILLAVPRFGALALAYALLLICRVGAPVVNRLKPVWDRFVASDDRTEATRPEERRAEAEARADRNARELLAAEDASRTRVRRRAPPPRKKKAPPPATRSPAPAPAAAPAVIVPAPPPPVAAPAPAPVPQPAVTVQAPAVAPAPAVAAPASAPPPAAAPPAPAASSAPAAEAPAPAAEAPAPAAEAPSPASEALAPVDAPAPARKSPAPAAEAPAPAAEAPAPADAPAPAPVEEPWQPAQPARRRSRAAREPTEPKAPTGRRRGTVKVVKPGYCFVVPDAGGPDVFCATRLNDTIAAGDRLEYDLVPNEGRSAHKAGNVTILPRAAPRPAPVPAPAPAAVKPVADKPAPRWSSAEAARDADALEFFYEGDASKLEPRFVASVESLLGQRRREQLARNFAAADALREGLRTSYGVVSSDHKQRGSRDPRTTWRIVKTPAPSTDGAAVRVVTASPEALARKAITVGGETLEDFLGRLGLLGYAARLHDEELTILDLPLASASDLVAVGLPRPAAERICASAQDGSPPEFLCPITMETMSDPVFAADGHVYDRASIESFLETHDTSPLTNEPLATKSLTPNDALRSRLRERATTL